MISCAIFTNSRGLEKLESVNSGTETCRNPNWFPHGDSASGLIISFTDLYPLIVLVLSSTNAVDCASVDLSSAVCIYNRVP
ncbi:hypothetical protein OIU78_025554 [Salix suchowensis]|nr:hypothetical protein OIU78_025554 [Salix suchowensis]